MIRGMGRRLNVSNVGQGVTRDALTALFQKHGQVDSVALVQDESGNRTGCAIVFMAREVGAWRARKMLNGFSFCGRNLRVVIGGSAFSDVERHGPRMSAPRDEPSGGGLKLRCGVPAFRPLSAAWIED